MKWYFSPQLPGQVETEVTQRDQFSNDDVQLSETIVREAIQNSLDAAIDDPAKIRVSIKLVNADDGLQSSFLNDIFKEQRKHASEAGLDIEDINFNEPTALIIEDFGTKGLTGSVNTKDNDNFSDFWRRHGKSHKTGKSRGRWGLGKLVYSSTSELGAFFGLTIREHDNTPHLMGQTVLNLRKVDGIEYPPHAFFADVDGKDNPYTEIPVPIKDKQIVSNFITQFCLERSDQPGLSVIIPFPNPNFSIDSLIGTAIANYFYPLTTGQLVLEFGKVTVDASTVRELAHKYAYDKFTNIDLLFNFIEEVYDSKPESLLQMKSSWSDDNKLDSDDFEQDDLETIRSDYSQGNLIGLKLPLTLTQKDGTKKETYFSVFLKKPESLRKGLDLYVRGGLTLPGEAKFRERNALGAMIADDEDICSFLGYAENAAHTQWVGNAEKLKQRYRTPNKIVRSIKHAVVELYDLLADEEEQIDEQALSSFFWIDEPEGTAQNKKKPRKTPLVIPEPPPPRPKTFLISTVEGGFSVISSREAASENFPQTIRIEMAYDVSSGNPFKKYTPLDFKLGSRNGIEIKLTKETGKLVRVQENILRIEVDKLPFKLKVTGFDDNRDLKVKLTKEA